jgi:hypothetical protein
MVSIYVCHVSEVIHALENEILVNMGHAFCVEENGDE